MAISIPKIFEEIAKAKNKDEKKSVLIKYSQNGAFKEILRYAFDPNIYKVITSRRQGIKFSS